MIRRLLEHRRQMREHRWTQAHLSDYLDHDLDPSERERIEAHTEICPDCRRALAALRRVLQELRGLWAEPKPRIADGVIERLRGEG